MTILGAHWVFWALAVASLPLWVWWIRDEWKKRK